MRGRAEEEFIRQDREDLQDPEKTTTDTHFIKKPSWAANGLFYSCLLESIRGSNSSEDLGREKERTTNGHEWTQMERVLVFDEGHEVQTLEMAPRLISCWNGRKPHPSLLPSC